MSWRIGAYYPRWKRVSSTGASVVTLEPTGVSNSLFHTSSQYKIGSVQVYVPMSALNLYE